MTYADLRTTLYEHADEKYREFHKRLLKNDSIVVIGVRMPVLRKLAKQLRGEADTLLSFPDEFYEVTFLKCAAAGLLPYKEFVTYVDRLVPLLDNWAICDGFISPCLEGRQGDFLPYVEKYLADGREFVVRYGLVTLLRYYMEERYLPCIFDAVASCGDKPYYAMMAAAWLLAEVLVKFYDAGRDFLSENTLTPVLRHKAIQKARESFRLTETQKKELRSLR